VWKGGVVEKEKKGGRHPKRIRGGVDTGGHKKKEVIYGDWVVRNGSRRLSCTVHVREGLMGGKRGRGLGIGFYCTIKRRLEGGERAREL